MKGKYLKNLSATLARFKASHALRSDVHYEKGLIINYHERTKANHILIT